MADTQPTPKNAPETPEQELARLRSENAKLKEENATATATLEEMGEQLANAEAAAPEQVVVKHENAQYRVLAQKFQHKGQEVKAADLKKNKELVAELIKSGSGLLQKIEAK
ncbi:hypothetical protein [Hymenobacter pini]|uniref:hypothetical protein n=1 Tax=Hymenobacter pini TaxID=2880879 RepID=UPI001CF33FEA|nr:hypothetical protein [Hymenobacter pini]MCA8831954.1 hypothetical protein [Hymenobacter pini]